MTCVYDGWNRLVQVNSGGTILAEFQYDGTGRRIVQFTNFTEIDSVSYPQAVTYFYFSGQNAIETRVGGTAASDIQYQYIFSPLGKDPLLRDTYVSGVISFDDRLYYLTDANTNVTAVVGLSGSTWAVQERYVYAPYGAVTVYSSDWTTDQQHVRRQHQTRCSTPAGPRPSTGLYDERRVVQHGGQHVHQQGPAQADENLYCYCGNGTRRTL